MSSWFHYFFATVSSLEDALLSDLVSPNAAATCVFSFLCDWKAAAGDVRQTDEVIGLTADFEVHVLVVLADGVAGGAEVLSCVRELDIFQGEGGHPRMAANHHVPVEALRRREGKKAVIYRNQQDGQSSGSRTLTSDMVTLINRKVVMQ